MALPRKMIVTPRTTLSIQLLIAKTHLLHLLDRLSANPGWHAPARFLDRIRKALHIRLLLRLQPPADVHRGQQILPEEEAVAPKRRLRHWTSLTLHGDSLFHRTPSLLMEPPVRRVIPLQV